MSFTLMLCTQGKQPGVSRLSGKQYPPYQDLAIRQCIIKVLFQDQNVSKWNAYVVGCMSWANNMHPHEKCPLALKLAHRSPTIQEIN